MSDLFEEVEEQLRSDRYRQLARRFLPWMLGIAAAALIAVLGYWGYDSFRGRQIAEASDKYAAAMDAFVGGDRARAKTLWSEVSESPAAGYKALALMHLAGLEADAKNPKGAAALLDEAAAASSDPLIADSARLKSAFALLDTAPLKDMEGRLKPLMEEGRPYRVQAREALAFAKLNAGDASGARGEFVLISQSLDAGQGAQARAQAAIALIDAGSAKAVPLIVKEAASLPPGALIDPAMLGGAPSEGPAPQ